MNPKHHSRFLSTSIPSLLALGGFADIACSQTTRTWDGGGVPATNMDIATNWSGDTVPTGTAPGDTAQWDGTVAGNLSLSYTAAGTGANLSAGDGVFLNILGTQTGSLTINEFSGTTGLRLRDLTVASGAGALTFGSTAGTDVLTLGSTAVLSHMWTNNSSNPVTFSSDVQFGAGGNGAHALTLTGTGNWNVNTSLIRNASGTINVIKDGAGTMNLGTVNSLGNAAFTINAGTLDNTSGAALTLTNTAQTWNGDFAYGTGAGTNLNDLSLGAGAVSLGTAAGTSRTITTNGGALLTVAGVISNGTTANSIIKSGTGGLRLDGTNTFTGGLTVNSGALHVANNAALGTGPLTFNGSLIVPRLASRTLANAVTVGSDFTLGATGVNNQLNFSGTMSLGGGTRTITVFDTTMNPDVTISGVISNGGLTKAGAGTMVLTGTSTFSGPMTVNGGLLRVNGTGTINSSSGITINGSDAKLLFTSSVASTPPITLTQGTLDATGTVGAVNVGASGTAILAHGNGGTATLTTGNLSFAGPATVKLASSSTGPGIAAGTLTTSGTNGAIFIDITRTEVWSNGANNLISFTSFPAADISDFDFNIASGPALGARQSLGALVLNGNNIALQVNGTSIYWTGLQSNQWTLSAVGGSKNWKQTSDNTATDFLDADQVVFDDTPGANQTVQINDGDVFTTTTTFNNSTVNYTFSSSGSFGISGGTLTKNGTGSVTLNTNNTYSGGTTLNAGTIRVNSASALGTGAVLINGGTLDNTSGGPVALASNNAQTWNGDFTFTGSNALDMGTGAVTGGGSGDRTVTVSANSLTVGELKTAASQGFIKQGTGTLVANSNGANTAGSVVNGVLNVAAGTLQMNGTTGTSGDFVAAGISGSGSITNGAATERAVYSNAATGSFNFSGSLSHGAAGALGINKSGASTQTLSGTSNYSGQTTVTGGTLSLSGTNLGGGAVSVNGSAATPAVLDLRSSTALGTSVVSSINRNSGIQLQGGITLPSTVSFVISNDGVAATVPYAIGNLGGDNTIGGAISLTTGGGNSIIQSDSGSLTLAGNMSIAPGQGSRNFVLQGLSTGANTVSGVVSDLSVTSVTGIIKNGPGTWTINGTNTYSGPTTVSAGTLVMSGNNSAASGDVTVAADATLAGNGNLGGNVTIATGGIHSLAVAATPGAQMTRTITGSLTQTGSVLNLSAAATPAAGVYVLATANGGIVGTPATINYNGISGAVAVNGNNLELTVFGSVSYATWAATNAGGQASHLDFDKDGVQNGVEYFMGATGSTFTANPGIVNGKVTWPKDPAFSGTYTVQTSPDLVTWTDVSSTVVGNTVEYTVPTGQRKQFVRLKVTPN
ncbi:autotransporter-associated beta strand repeat-containing protein [Haloferula sp. BvORR071]|uniref:beta strand repeat-containing protein n=1 Tax=Haloferula sp. BvORR071 TaxID=1396141 RepID=UPI00054E9127|nr:autotransporter-associated beta strand repeat-containing protein [Haloferula sp. BvORR071]